MMQCRINIKGLGILVFLALMVAACTDELLDTSAQSMLDEDLVPAAGKADTAYYSNLATELEGEFTSVLRLDVSELDLVDQEAEVERLNNTRYIIRQLADEQLKLAKSQLNAEKLHLNLTSDSIEIDRIEIVNDAIEIGYRIVVETLVTQKELQEEGLRAADLVDANYPVNVAADPRNLFDRVGERCATGFDAGSLRNENFFYYFDPALPSCDIELAQSAQFSVRTLLPNQETYPEYDLLVADQMVTAAVIFGAAAPGPAHGGDWGVMMWRTFEANLRISDFVKTEADTPGNRYVRTRSGIDEVIDVISPYVLEEKGDESDQLFAELLGTHELMFYNGHSFYGSLDVLKNRQHYPPETYQILFMNSCWSYEYYTRQVSEARSTEADPDGWRLADVVNNTTYAYFVQMEQSSRVLLFNILAGAESMGADNAGRRFSWQNIIGTLNSAAKNECPRDDPDADCRHYRPRTAHEMYGVSGVRDNQFTPNSRSAN
jgi:hypothetical protein